MNYVVSRGHKTKSTKCHQLCAKFIVLIKRFYIFLSWLTILFFSSRRPSFVCRHNSQLLRQCYQSKFSFFCFILNVNIPGKNNRHASCGKNQWCGAPHASVFGYNWGSELNNWLTFPFWNFPYWNCKNKFGLNYVMNLHKAFA